MKSWSGRPFGATVAAEVVAGKSNIVSPGGGESKEVYEIADYPGWLVKLYKESPAVGEVDALERLISLPGGMSPDELAMVDKSMAWPVSRVVDDVGTVGVVMAKAPEPFYADFLVSEGRIRRIPLIMDHLAESSTRHEKWGIQPLSLYDRLRVVRCIAEVGNLIESKGLVYGDWSYSNAFWSRQSLGTFVIDVDSCRFGRRPWVEGRTGVFSDPLLGQGQPITALHDRYRIALLIVRCLTGTRYASDATEVGLPTPLQDSDLARLLWAILAAPTVTSRPSLPELLTALDEALEVTRDDLGADIDDEADRRQIAEEIAANVVAYRSVKTGELIPAGRARVLVTAEPPEQAAESGNIGRPPAWPVAVAVAAIIILIIVIVLLIGYLV